MAELSQEERRFRRALRPSWKSLEIWFWVSRIPVVLLFFCLVTLGLLIAAAGGWIRWKLLTELGWI